MSESFRITYSLVATGWSKCIVESSDAHVELSASYLSDALGNLVLSGIAAASNFHSVEFGFDEEPGEYRWSVSSAENNAVRLRIFEFHELWGNKPTDSGRLLFEAVLTPLAYARAVYACAAAVLEEHGSNAYLEKWVEHPFPAQALELLAAAISCRHDA
ncbi:MAG: hypothetical protein U0X73_05940 [Thermoanaerobaculia bacterium]